MKISLLALIPILLIGISCSSQSEKLKGTWELERYQEYGKWNGELKLEDDVSDFYETEYWKFDNDSLYKLNAKKRREDAEKYVIEGDTIWYKYWEMTDKYFDFFEIIKITDEHLELKTESKRKVNYYYLRREDD